MYMVTVDKAKCDGDGACVNVCPQGVFKMASASAALPASRIARSRQLPSRKYNNISNNSIEKGTGEHPAPFFLSIAVADPQ
jgi:ferredoxin